jgi:plastocyanin domain-containing protein
MKNTTLLAFAILVIAGIGFFMFRGVETSTTGAAIDDAGDAQVQAITLSLKNGNYYPESIKVKVGEPVSITLDKSVTGCYRSLVIRGLGISAYSKVPGETIEFIPEKPGTYRFSCSMGMGYGTLVVK